VLSLKEKYGWRIASLNGFCSLFQLCLIRLNPILSVWVPYFSPQKKAAHYRRLFSFSDGMILP